MEHPLSIEARAQLLGISCADVVRLTRATWCAGPMVATPSARWRLQAWARLGCPTPDPDVLPCIGDPVALLEAHSEVWSHLPVPVRHFVSTAVVVYAIGRTLAGFQSRPPAQPATTPYGPPQVVTVDYGRPNAAALLAHELAHAWHYPMTDTDPAPTALAYVRSGLEAYDPAEPADLYPSETLINEEVLAADLARHWGFTGAPADPTPHRRRLAALRKQRTTPPGGGIGSSALVSPCGCTGPQGIARR